MSHKDFEEISPIEVPLSEASKYTPVSDSQADAVASKKNTPVNSSEWYQNKTTMFALVVSILLALFVIFVLPEMVSEKNRMASNTAATPVEIVAAKKVIDESPFQKAQLAKARRESQDVLDKLLKSQAHLESKVVTEWAPEIFSQAMKEAAAGDIEYRQQNFESAILKYQEALNELMLLEQSIPGRIDSALLTGEQYLLNGDSSLAQQAYALALILDPESEDAQRGVERSLSLDAVMAEIEKGDDRATNQQLEEAIVFYERALAIDPMNKSAAEKLENTSEAVMQLRFLAAMSQGYDALDRNDASAAVIGFKKALAINVGDVAATNALQQALNKQSSQWLKQAFKRALSLEKEEDWSEAVQQYQAILAKDNSIVDARVGELRSSARLTLDDRINTFIKAPQRLSSLAVMTSAKNTLADAVRVANPGNKLTEQINQLTQAINFADSPQEVTVLSDSKTVITLLKVGMLGQFDKKNLRLKPGQYVAVGMREGYRDVRVEFDVVADPARDAAVNVVCLERI